MRFEYRPLALPVVAACAHEPPKVEAAPPAVVQVPREERPVDPEHNQAAWAANRRDDVQVHVSASAAR